MAKPRVFWRFASDAGTVTASSESYGEAAERLQSRHLAEKWRSGTTTAAEWLKVDLGAAYDVNAFALLAHDLDGTETLTLEANATDSWGAPAFSQAVTWREGALVEFFPTEARRWWRLRIDKAAAGNQRSAGRLLLGSYLEIGRSWSERSLRIGEDDPSGVQLTPGGQAYGDGAQVLRTVEGDLRGLTDAEAAELALLGRTYGKAVPWVLSGDHDAAPVDWLFYGRGGFRARKALAPAASGEWWEAALSLVEVA